MRSVVEVAHRRIFIADVVEMHAVEGLVGMSREEPRVSPLTTTRPVLDALDADSYGVGGRIAASYDVGRALSSGRIASQAPGAADAFRYPRAMAWLTRGWRRRRALRREFPTRWREILARGFPRYLRLAPDDRREFERLMKVFLAEKRFEGASGLEVSDEIRLIISAQACLLLLHRDTDVYSGLSSIIVYPEEYVARGRVHDEIGLVREATHIRLGETSGRGAVVVSWDASLRGALTANAGRNLVFHEFAHLLDAESGGFDGAPLFPLRSMYARWSRVMEDEYAALKARTAEGASTDLDPYGATSPAEFFAVATERFFQEPTALFRDRPLLFGELVNYYQQDPRAFWNEEARH